MKILPIYLMTILALCIAIAATANAQPGPASLPSAQPVKVVSEAPPESDDVEMDDVLLEGDVLTLVTAYGCGCAEHTFELYWDGGFVETAPVQTSLTLVHDAHGESCEMACEEALRFDLSQLRERYIVGYGAPGTIVIHVAGAMVEYTF